MQDLFESYAPPGETVQVTGHRFHLYCLGRDVGPPALFEAGQAGFSLDWMLAQPAVSAFARTCAYDRAGLGWSEADSPPGTPQQIVEELHALLTATLTSKPYILVAYSLGGRHTRLFAQRYPDDVAGQILVDAYHENFDRGLANDQLRAFPCNRSRQYQFLSVIAPLGAAQLFGQQLVDILGADYHPIPRQERRRYAQLATCPNPMATTIDEHKQAVVAGMDAPFGICAAMPLRILTHGVHWRYPEQEQLWQESQR